MNFNTSGDPIDFLSWFLNALHIALNGSKKHDSSIVYRSFLGSMRIYTRKIPPIELEEEQKEALLLMDEYQEKVTESPFLYLTCDLPPPPLFKDEFRENIIPQVRARRELQSALAGGDWHLSCSGAALADSVTLCHLYPFIDLLLTPHGRYAVNCLYY
jgi:hypothetical protein